MEMYLFKSALCLAVFFIFYKLLLENTSLHTLKRFYLIGALISSFGIPLVTFTTYVETSAMISELNPIMISDSIIETTALDYLAIALWSIYAVGFLYFGLRFAKNLRIMIGRIRSNPKLKNDSIINVLLREHIIPHTFFNYIFLNKERFEQNEIPKEVMAHEITHAKEKHSIDILLIEILGVIFWFNPLFYLIRRAMKLNHEFLADRSVLREGTDLTTYQNIVLAFSSNVQSPVMANSINYSFIKKRFTVMKANTSKRAAFLKSMLLLPLLALALYSFSAREIIETEERLYPEHYDLQQSATREEMKEYNALAKKYNAVPIEQRVIKLKELKRLEYIYRKMSNKQKADAEPFPECPPPPPPPPPDAPKAVNPVNAVKASTPPPPPPPPPAPESPLDQIVLMAKKGATFYYEGEEISSDKAIELIKGNNKLNIHTRGFADAKPVVRINKKPFKSN